MTEAPPPRLLIVVREEEGGEVLVLVEPGSDAAGVSRTLARASAGMASTCHDPHAVWLEAVTQGGLELKLATEGE